MNEAQACERHLRRSSSEFRLLDKATGLRPELGIAFASFTSAARDFLESARDQLAQLDLHHRFHFGLVEDVADMGQASSSRQEAYAIRDTFAEKSEVPTSFLLFTFPFVRDIFLAWDAMLSHPELFPEIGRPQDERPLTALAGSRPEDPQRALYAQDQALLTLELALFHEFFHVASGHLDIVQRKGEGACLHEVTASAQQEQIDAKLRKVLELDADTMAIRHMTMRVLDKKTLVPHASLMQADDVGRLRHVGRCATLLFRLIELWRRNVRRIYRSCDLHPHPDIRDSTLFAYLKQSADPEGVRSAEFGRAYGRGRDDIIEALVVMNVLAPNFGIVEGMGQDLAIRETEWLIPELNRVRKEGVGPGDFRRMAAQRRASDRRGW